ncbi:MAG: acetylornithine carbamoyltransferase [Chitinophagaceae bacterium]|nr:MAG: acetylornithine carbamoyltransferase [Chitinophagaceae bacterium]
MKQFISANDVPDIPALIQKALDYKANPWKDETLGKHKRIGCLFLNPSMRTRLSTQVAAKQLGMDSVIFNLSQEGWALEFEDGAIMNGTSVEHVKDAAPILGNYFDILAVRTFPSLQNREEDNNELIINQFIKYAGIPVISLESATMHPLQSFTDLITIQESVAEQNLENKKIKVVLTWAPHVKALPQCVANSFAQWVNKWGKADFVITHPEGYDLNEEYTKGATIVHDQEKALAEADFIYVKNWSSYNDYGQVLSIDQSWMLTNEKLKNTNNAKVMHCLPVRRNVELSDEILDGPNSLITKEASNRVWAAQAVIAEILNTMPNKTK